MNRLIKIIKNPRILLSYIVRYRPFHLLPDKKFIKLEYFLRMGNKLNLNEPQTYNEKLQWLKLNDKNPLNTQLVDKYEVRKYIKETIGKEYLIPLYGVYDSFEEIDFEKLPNEFVLKANHTSGDFYLCKDKTKINYSKLKKEVDSWLKRDFYLVHREWPYKNVTPKILVEKYMEEIPNEPLKDYKIMCFNGEPKIIQIMSERSKDGFFLNHFDKEWNELEIQRQSIQKNPENINKPEKLNKMLRIAKILSENLPFIRVDLYYINGDIYFGELTFYPANGHMDFVNEDDDHLLGKWITLPFEDNK